MEEGSSSATKEKTPKKNISSPPPQPPVVPPASKVHTKVHAAYTGGALYAVPLSWAFPADDLPRKKAKTMEVDGVDGGLDDDILVIDAEPLSQIPPPPSPPPPPSETKNKTSKPNDHFIRESRFFDGTSCGLPEGWTVEQRKRIPTVIDNPLAKESRIRVDQFYYEPGTNKQFRSRASVEAHLRQQSKKLEEGSSSADGGNGQQQNSVSS